MTASIYTFGGFYDDPDTAAHKAQQLANQFLWRNNIQPEDIITLQTTMHSTLLEDEQAIRIDVVITLLINDKEESTK